MIMYLRSILLIMVLRWFLRQWFFSLVPILWRSHGKSGWLMLTSTSSPGVKEEKPVCFSSRLWFFFDAWGVHQVASWFLFAVELYASSWRYLHPGRWTHGKLVAVKIVVGKGGVSNESIYVFMGVFDYNRCPNKLYQISNFKCRVHEEGNQKQSLLSISTCHMYTYALLFQMIG